MSSGIAVDDSVVTAYNEMKLKKSSTKILAMKISDDKKTIVIDDENTSANDYLHLGTLVSDSLKQAPRYIILDYDYVTQSNAQNSKLIFVYWSPDSAHIKEKMLYASSKDALIKKLEGVQQSMIQANDASEVAKDVLDDVVKSKK